MLEISNRSCLFFHSNESIRLNQSLKDQGKFLLHFIAYQNQFRYGSWLFSIESLPSPQFLWFGDLRSPPHRPCTIGLSSVSWCRLCHRSDCLHLSLLAIPPLLHALQAKGKSKEFSILSIDSIRCWTVSLWWSSRFSWPMIDLDCINGMIWHTFWIDIQSSSNHWKAPSI